MAIIHEIKLTKVTSTDLNVSTVVLPAQVAAYGKIGAKMYMVIGDGVTQIQDLPKLAFGQLAEWGQITGTLSAQTDLVNALAAKLDKNWGSTNIGKILVVASNGDTVLASITISDIMTKDPSFVAGEILIYNSNGDAISSGTTLSTLLTTIGDKLTRPDLKAGSNVVLTPGTGNTVTIAVPGIPLPDKWVSTENGIGPIGNSETHDSTLLTRIVGAGTLDAGDVVIFANGYQGEVVSVNTGIDKYDAIIVQVPQQVTWGGITGMLSNQTDLINALNAKLAISQGIGNAGKIVGVDSSGNLAVMTLTQAGIDLSKKVDISQGAGNANKILVTNPSGNVTTSNVIDGGTI